MPTNLEYALLAANVYGASAQVRSNQNTLPIPVGWDSLGTAAIPTTGEVLVDSAQPDPEGGE